MAGPLWGGTRAPPASITCGFLIQAARLSSAVGDSARVFAFDFADPAGTYRARLSLVVAAGGSLSFAEDYVSLSGSGAPSALTPLDGPFHTLGMMDASVVDAGQPPPSNPDSGTPPTDLDSGAEIDSGNAANPVTVVPFGLGFGPFYSVEINVSAGPPSTFTIHIGPAVVNGTLAQPLPQAMTASVALGAVALGQSSAGWSFFYDNFICY